MTEPAVKALTCPACGAPVTLRAAGYTVSVTCASCGSTLDALAPDLALIKQADAVARVPRIPLGARGEINGVAWDAVGYMERTAGSSRWSEYLLFNPYYGYRFLSDDGRRWSLGRLIDGEPRSAGPLERRLGEARLPRVEAPYDATVSFVLGEFYWRVTAGETVRVTDYATPGVMLSLEEAGDELTWTRNDLLDHGVVEKAFGIAQRSAAGQRPSPHEPSPWGSLLKPIWAMAALACVILVGLCYLTPDKVDLGGHTLPARLDMPGQTATISPFDLSRPHNRVVLHAWGNGLDNAWIDADVSLVNQKTQQSYDGYALTEHYSGHDSDGYWSEGASATDLVFSHVPRGRYDLVVNYSAHTWSNAASSSSWTASASSAPGVDDHPDVQLGLDVKTGGIGDWNFILAAIAILAAPVALSLAHHMFNRRRRD
jgi:hypothetical protein